MFKSARRMIRKPLRSISTRKNRRIQKPLEDVEAPRANRKRMVSDMLHGMQPWSRDEDELSKLVSQAQVSLDRAAHGSRQVESASCGCCQAEIKKPPKSLVEDEASSGDSDAGEEEDYQDTQQSLKDLLAPSKAGVDPLHGNMYRHWAFGQGRASLTAKTGQVCVMIIQIVAPAAICVWNCYALHVTSSSRLWFGYDHLTYRFGTDDQGVSNLFRNLLSFVFLLAFLLNAAQSNYEEARNWQKCALLANILKDCGSIDHSQMAPIWFLIGPVINCQCLLFCCVDTWLLMYTSVDNVSDVVMNVLAIFFLYGMDDIGCDLDFFDEDDWDPDLMGQLFSEYCTKPKVAELPAYYFGMQQWSVENRDDHWRYYKHPHPAYAITAMILWLFLILIPCAFLFISGISNAADNYELGELEDKLADLKAQGFTFI